VNNVSIYYVVDPGQTKDNCNLDVDFKGKVIIVASHDEGHWGGSEFLKQRGTIKGLFMFMPVWSLDELLNAKQHFECSVLDEDIISRYQKVGGIPRHIFTTAAAFANVLDDSVATTSPWKRSFGKCVFV
jgi:hypothetical protein